MASETGPERYRICIDSSVASKDALFSRVTDTAYLGYSAFNGWDAFYDMFWLRLEYSDIVLEIDNHDPSALPEQDRSIWLECIHDLQREFPTKLLLVHSGR